jgi:hypothetical protein
VTIPSAITALASKLQCLKQDRQGEAFMETVLIIALIGWAALGVNLLLTYNNDSAASSDVRQ